MKLMERKPNDEDADEFMKCMKKVLNKREMLSTSITSNETLFQISKTFLLYNSFSIGFKTIQI